MRKSSQQQTRRGFARVLTAVLDGGIAQGKLHAEGARAAVRYLRARRVFQQRLVVVKVRPAICARSIRPSSDSETHFCTEDTAEGSGNRREAGRGCVLTPVPLLEGGAGAGGVDVESRERELVVPPVSLKELQDHPACAKSR